MVEYESKESNRLKYTEEKKTQQKTIITGRDSGDRESFKKNVKEL